MRLARQIPSILEEPLVWSLAGHLDQSDSMTEVPETVIDLPKLVGTALPGAGDAGMNLNSQVVPPQGATVRSACTESSCRSQDKCTIQWIWQMSPSDEVRAQPCNPGLLR